MIDSTDFYGTGRRKTAIARVHLRSGKGNIIINDKEYSSFEEYFKSESLAIEINKPFNVTNTIKQFDLFCRIEGGGLAGQAGALQLGISRALLILNGELRTTLRDNDLLTRDPRMVERKKIRKAKGKEEFPVF
jgi:small subunit ribosomal protein S9